MEQVATRSNKKILSGNEAIAHGAYAGGVTVASAYPGTPSTEILENVASSRRSTVSGLSMRRST